MREPSLSLLVTHNLGRVPSGTPPNQGLHASRWRFRLPGQLDEGFGGNPARRREPRHTTVHIAYQAQTEQDGSGRRETGCFAPSGEKCLGQAPTRQMRKAFRHRPRHLVKSRSCHAEASPVSNHTLNSKPRPGSLDTSIRPRCRHNLAGHLQAEPCAPHRFHREERIQDPCPHILQDVHFRISHFDTAALLLRVHRPSVVPARGSPAEPRRFHRWSREMSAS